MKVLFVCTAAQQRSPTAVDVVKEFYPWHEAKFAGIHELSEIPIAKESVDWADLIFAMEKMHKDFILEKFPESVGKNIITLGIPDIYYKGDPELVNMLKKKLRGYLN